MIHGFEQKEQTAGSVTNENVSGEITKHEKKNFRHKQNNFIFLSEMQFLFYLDKLNWESETWFYACAEIENE